MQEKTNLTIRIDKQTRDDFNKLCDEIGITAASAIVALIKQAVRDKRLSFSLTEEHDFYETKNNSFV